jgi:hypothetical protein
MVTGNEEKCKISQITTSFGLAADRREEREEENGDRAVQENMEDLYLCILGNNKTRHCVIPFN